jgi:hypothetical protein
LSNVKFKKMENKYLYYQKKYIDHVLPLFVLHETDWMSLGMNTNNYTTENSLIS